MFKLYKRPMLLLEVLIALALVALCSIPLLYPHVALVMQQKSFVKVMEAERTVNLMHVELLALLQQNKIPWSAIQEHQAIPIDDLMKEMTTTIPFTGTYKFTEGKHKFNDQTGWHVYLLTVTFTVGTPKQSKPYVFPYDVCLMRKAAPAQDAPEETPDKQKPSEGKIK